MSVLLSLLIAQLPNVFLSLLAPLVTKTFLTRILRHVVIFALTKAAAMTTNTVDDEMVKDIQAAFDAQQTPNQNQPGGFSEDD